MTGEVELTTVVEEQERPVLIEIRDGFYCVDCQQACYIGLAPGQAEGLRCGCTWVPYDGGTKIEHWIPVTITITKRSSK